MKSKEEIEARIGYLKKKLHEAQESVKATSDEDLMEYFDTQADLHAEQIFQLEWVVS